MCAQYVRAEPKSLRELTLDEKWLQDKISEDPTILGLGDLVVLERERSQPSGGRLDFLLSDPEEGIRYEVEVMLGRLDESHIIRTIEYWDIERTRFPQMEHRAVIIAEDITNRFFNIISLLNRAVPIIAVQMNAMQVGEQFILTFTKVLDIAELFGEDETAPGDQVDRAHWIKRTNPASLGVVDKLITMLEAFGPRPRVTYNKSHIAVGTSGRNFMWLNPGKTAPHCHMQMLIGGDDRVEWLQRLDEAGIFAGARGKNMKLRLSQKELADNEPLLRELLQQAEASSRS